MTYILYKHPVQLDTLAVVQYLHHNGHTNAAPIACIERNHPTWAAQLPSILCTKTSQMYIGKHEVVRFYESTFGVDRLIDKARAFKDICPNYKIH